ncbi:hypothetical protein BEWA_027000 [Theileria equi strain WA]|uniref:Uncharacterized protein n=1 Tax=Theileria equi strain WA TaxID=1537102 RepID=L0AXV3_THEEQ|nr:hypothetical protein BEWA_027000 [Theileria equi strain WA]AFZ79851.1 hypothetical protein BEWA_027000 [Theileria equi strain WA]|eukprot:XP_004829517.1 hypothetical protein BEWA_027000 [Theileria equi strain WA]
MVSELIGDRCIDSKEFGELIEKLGPQTLTEKEVLETLRGICPQNGKTVGRRTLGHALKTNNKVPTAKFDRFLKSLGIPEEQEMVDIEALAKALVACAP